MTDFASYARLPGVNWARLRHLNDSPAHYRYHETHPIEETASLRIGRAVHAAVLEFERLPADFTVYAGRRDDRVKEWVDFKAANTQRTILSQAEWDEAVMVAEAVRSDSEARRLLTRAGECERTLRWRDKPTGLMCKGRPDKIIPGNARFPGMIVELKTTVSLRGNNWALTMARNLYHGQAAYYATGVQAVLGKNLPVVMIVVEKETGIVLVKPLSDDALYEGELLVRRLLDRLAECRRSRKWPGPYEGVQRLELPPWAYRENGTEKEEQTDVITILRGARP